MYSQDRTIVGLLGAYPSVSTAPPIMIDVLEKVFKDQVATPAWQEKTGATFPSHRPHLLATLVVLTVMAKEWRFG